MNPANFTDPRADIAGPLSEHLSAYLGRRAQARGLTRLTGGSSNETWAFELQVEADEAPIPLVLRRCFASSPLEVRLDTEFELLQTLHRLGLPVPRPWTCALSDSPLRSPFMVVSRAPGTDVRKLLAKNASPLTREQLGAQLVGVLARIHAVDWRRELRALTPPAAADVARHEVERWAPDIETVATTRPLLLATLDWLRAHAPNDATLCLVHGDFKANNLLFGEGRTQAVIDWELAHIGDPFEDLAWTLLWDTGHDLVNGLLSPSAFLASYAAAANRAMDGRRLFFWQVFSLFKLAAIFLRGLKTATPNHPVRPMLIQLARALPHLEQQLAALLVAALDDEELPR
ncbi:MAG: phosphotransferase family protein [Panacagrimonas sp.]